MFSCSAPKHKRQGFAPKEILKEISTTPPARSKTLLKNYVKKAMLENYVRKLC